PSPKDVVRSVATRSEPNTILDLSGAEAVTTASAAERRGRRGIVGALVALAIAGAILASMWLAHPFRAATSHGGPAPGQSAGPSPSGSTPPPSPGPATPFTSTFPESAKGGGVAGLRPAWPMDPSEPPVPLVALARGDVLGAAVGSFAAVMGAEERRGLGT